MSMQDGKFHEINCEGCGTLMGMASNDYMRFYCNDCVDRAKKEGIICR